MVSNNVGRFKRPIVYNPKLAKWQKCSEDKLFNRLHQSNRSIGECTCWHKKAALTVAFSLCIKVNNGQIPGKDSLQMACRLYGIEMNGFMYKGETSVYRKRLTVKAFEATAVVYHDAMWDWRESQMNKHSNLFFSFHTNNAEPNPYYVTTTISVQHTMQLQHQRIVFTHMK